VRGRAIARGYRKLPVLTREAPIAEKVVAEVCFTQVALKDRG
jgi:hypothetical protein